MDIFVDGVRVDEAAARQSRLPFVDAGKARGAACPLDGDRRPDALRAGLGEDAAAQTRTWAFSGGGRASGGMSACRGRSGASGGRQGARRREAFLSRRCATEAV